MAATSESKAVAARKKAAQECAKRLHAAADALAKFSMACLDCDMFGYGTKSRRGSSRPRVVRDGGRPPSSNTMCGNRNAWQ